MSESNLSKSDLEEICHSLGLPSEGVKADLIQRLRSHSNMMENSNMTVGENQTCAEDINLFIGQHLAELDTAGENPEINSLRERVQQTRKIISGEPSLNTHQDSVNQQEPADSTLTQEISDQLSRNSIRQNKRRLQEDINDNQGDSLEKLLASEFKNLRSVIADFDYKLNSVAAQVNKVEINESWPSYKFDKARDQHEYDAMCAIGKELDLALDLQHATNIINHVTSTREFDKLLKGKKSLIEKAKALAEVCKNKKGKLMAWKKQLPSLIGEVSRTVIGDLVQRIGVIPVVVQDIMQTHAHLIPNKTQIKEEGLNLSQEVTKPIGTTTAALLGLEAFVNLIAHHWVVVYIDNQHNVQIHEFCWVSLRLNLADELTRFFDESDWELVQNGKYSGHSLCIGGATGAMKAGDYGGFEEVKLIAEAL
ncbi:14889_t:CDS:2, partial [Dentiscutata erythropus]